MLQRIYGTAWQTKEQVCADGAKRTGRGGHSRLLVCVARRPAHVLSPPCHLPQLDAYHRFNEEAALRDHRRLGLELDLFRWGSGGTEIDRLACSPVPAAAKPRSFRTTPLVHHVVCAS